MSTLICTFICLILALELIVLTFLFKREKMFCMCLIKNIIYGSVRRTTVKLPLRISINNQVLNEMLGELTSCNSTNKSLLLTYRVY